jgi:phenylpyruvate tautomerase PptA (4-oxalocrotonate tautomerase family)
MPIITIHAKIPQRPGFSSALSEEISRTGAEAFGEEPSNFWVRLTTLDSDWNHPFYITILAKSGRDEKTKSRFVDSIAAVAARHLETVPEKIWIHYQELDLKDIWYGGQWGTASK